MKYGSLFIAIGLFLCIFFKSSVYGESQLPIAIAEFKNFSSNELREHANSKVFKLLTKVHNGTEKCSYGTAFVVEVNGLLITNYHVVSSAFLEPKKFFMELAVDNQIYTAKIVALDIPNDLALVQIPHLFTDAYQFATALPQPGEKLFSLGVPEDTVLTITEGLFSDHRVGPVSRLLFTATLNKGMSGGPVINGREEVVGINDAMMANAQNISIASPGPRAQALLKLIKDPKEVPELLDHKTFFKEQIENVVEPWMELWGKSQTTTGGPKFGNIQLTAPPPGLKCWQDDVKSVFGYYCNSTNSFHLYENQRSGGLELRYSWVKKAMGAFSSDTVANLKEEGFKHFSKWTNVQGGYKRYICSHRYVSNNRSEKMLAEYCVAESLKGSQLFDFALSVIPLPQKFQFVGEMQLHGFTARAVEAASEAFLSSIQVINPNGSPAGEAP